MKKRDRKRHGKLCGREREERRNVGSKKKEGKLEENKRH